ncbi:ATP-binding response regulator [Tautonia marina]|uniref:ATP-binding response regulator n=1 Tax=Tautonia marina TaxID=2653855 RepID=UPI0013761868|nr:hybrid sensor histidine kinase/response regulator [Tautonia marina]
MIAGTLEILVVEDDVDARETLHDLLEQDGFRVTLAGSIAEINALGPDEWSHFDIALLDRRFPDGTIDVLLPRLRLLAPHCAIILLTASCEHEGLLAALRVGVVDYLTKPLEADALRASLQRIARLREAEQRAQAAEQLASLGQMLVVLAHEGRNALNRTKIALQLAKLTCDGDPDLAPVLETGLAGCRDLERLFGDLRSQAGPLQLDLRPCDLYRVARDAWNDLEARREGRSARLILQGAPEARDCLADSFRMKQVFRNLFENSLHCGTDPVEIRVQCQAITPEGKPALWITVRDNGPGFSPQIRRQAFKPFFTTRHEGSGLGLSITRRIIEAHGGWITLTNASPGAEVLILLPMGGPDPALSILETATALAPNPTPLDPSEPLSPEAPGHPPSSNLHNYLTPASLCSSRIRQSHSESGSVE